MGDPNTDTTFLPTVAEGTWQDLPLEILPDHKTLPLLVLRAAGTGMPLRLQLHEADPNAGKSSTQFWIERALIQAQQLDNTQRYRVRLALRKWTARTLDLEFPVGTSDIEGFLDGRSFDIREASADAEGNRLIRLSLPAWQEGVPALLELRYRLPVASGEGIAGWVKRWYAPRPRRPVAVGVVRWQVGVPMRSVPLSFGATSFEERWSVRNGLPNPVAARGTSELDQWITAGIEPDVGNDPGWELDELSITARQGNFEPLRVVVVPHTAWLLVVSFVVLMVGFLLSRCARRTVGLILTLFAAVGVVLGFSWPQPTGHVLSAGIPGVGLLMLILAVQRVIVWRYRRRLARLPGFTQAVGSSMIRSGSKRPIVREASTIDSPVEQPWANG